MEHFYKSAYNIIKMHDEKLLLLNTLKGSFVGIDGKLKDDAVRKLENPNTIINQKLFNILLDNGFIVCGSVNEKDLLDKLRNGFIKNNALNLIMFTTEKCNFRCKYCYENFEGASMTEEVQSSTIEFVRNNIGKYKSFHIHWFGGEPLLTVDIIESMSKQLKQICRENHVLYMAGITTNGYNLTPQNIEILKECGVYRYQFTVDGLCDTHDRQRVLFNGGGTWSAIINNLKYLRDNIKSGLLSVSIRTNLTKEIFDQREEYIDFIMQEFGADKRFAIEFGLAADFGMVQDKEIIGHFCTKQQLFETIVCALNKNVRSQNIESLISPGGLLCHAWRDNTFSVRPDGTIGKCTINLYKQINKIGNIKKNEEGFYSSYWDAGAAGMPDMCKACVKYPICLKVDCKMPTHRECGNEIQYLEQFLPNICKPQYGYKTITEEMIF